MQIYIFTAMTALEVLVFVNGWTDAPNAITCPIVTGCMKPGKAIAMAGIFNLAGCLSMCFFGGKVAEITASIADFSFTGGTGLPALKAFSAGIIAVVFWAFVAWIFGIPTSESHGLLAAVSGAAVAYAVKNGASPIAAIDGKAWVAVGIGLAVSTLPAYLAAKACALITGRIDKNSIKPHGTFYKNSQITLAAIGAYLHGAQDGQKFVGMFIMLRTMTAYQAASDKKALIPAALTAVIMTLGTLMGGTRIIKHTGSDMVTLDLRRGFCADIASGTILAACLGMGLPVSTTHAKNCAIMGAGREPDMKIVRELICAWVLTFPICATLGFLLALAFSM